MFNRWILIKNMLVSGRILRSMVFIFHYNIRADPMLGIGYVSIRQIQCRCYAYLRKMSSPWNIIQDKYNQVWYKGENKKVFIGLS